MKRTLLFILTLFLLTAQAEKISSPLVHAEEYPSDFVVDEDLLAVDISPVITFQTDEDGVFAVVVLASSDELPTPAPPPSPAPSAFIVTSTFTARSITYTFTPIPTEGAPQ